MSDSKNHIFMNLELYPIVIIDIVISYHRTLMVLVWWSSAGVIHYSFTKPGTAITADVYINQLDEMMRKFSLKQPGLVNRGQPIFLQDNARPHVARKTLLKIQQLN